MGDFDSSADLMDPLWDGIEADLTLGLETMIGPAIDGEDAFESFESSGGDIGFDPVMLKHVSHPLHYFTRRAWRPRPAVRPVHVIHTGSALRASAPTRPAPARPVIPAAKPAPSPAQSSMLNTATPGTGGGPPGFIPGDPNWAAAANALYRSQWRGSGAGGVGGVDPVAGGGFLGDGSGYDAAKAAAGLKG